ncbi:hypothetical protein A9179_13510 [Pseudomonas alcaligenes]|uniref:YjiS-like domain-containing protein n=1 Tax=Aquipseudomonas alcaligenes TaxID=43263 RepID=A0ABR7S2N0_AQUAC|nr:DUF1127 domain-containing protein [Pseudomonas alcaligenes]MBC9251287.1 hypothetical protein [Pseudomonas alcaligenes]
MKGQKGYAVAQPLALGRIQPRLAILALWRQLKRWWQLAQERRMLAQLDDAALKDMGLNRGDVLRETERPFWDDPFRH